MIPTPFPKGAACNEPPLPPVFVQLRILPTKWKIRLECTGFKFFSQVYEIATSAGPVIEKS